MKERKITFKERMNIIKDLSKTDKWTFINLFLCDVGASVFSNLYPVIFGLLIDEVFYNGNIKYLKIVLIVYVTIYLCTSMLYFIQRLALSYLMTDHLFKTRYQLLHNTLYSKGINLINQNTGDNIAVINKDTEEIINFLHYNLFYPVASIIRLIFTIGIILIYNVYFAILLLLLVPVCVYVGMYISNGVRKLQEKYRDKFAKYISWINELLTGMREVHLLAGKRNLDDKFEDETNNLENLRANVNWKEVVAERVIAGIGVVATICMYYLAARLIIEGHLTLGMFVASLDYFDSANKFLRNLSSVFTAAQKNFVSIDKVIGKLYVETENNSLMPIKITLGNIKIDNVTFSYVSGNKILNNLCITIPAKSTVAFVGKSGHGKSTIVNLIVGIYDTNNGKILIDEQDITKYSFYSLRKQIAYVQQEPIMFEGTIKDNLKLVNENATDEEIYEVCRKAEIYEDIMSLPNKFDTYLDNRKNNLSGGQRQRLSIARALLKNTQIIIFDEATSSLDYITEKDIMNTLKKVSEDKTVIIIAHRLSTVVNADKIMLIDNGSIAGEGKHDDLMKNNSLYHNLFQNE